MTDYSGLANTLRRETPSIAKHPSYRALLYEVADAIEAMTPILRELAADGLEMLEQDGPAEGCCTFRGSLRKPLSGETRAAVEHAADCIWLRSCRLLGIEPQAT